MNKALITGITRILDLTSFVWYDHVKWPARTSADF